MGPGDAPRAAEPGADTASTDEEAPDDLDTDRYISIPHKNDLDLGSQLALRFAAEELPEHQRRIEGFFRRRGAYARLKELLAELGRLERWYAFEAESTKSALKEWCAANGIEVIDDDHK